MFSDDRAPSARARERGSQVAHLRPSAHQPRSVEDENGAAVATSTPTTTAVGEYDLDPIHSRVGFAVRHAMVTKVRGHFSEFSGRAYLDQQLPSASRVQVVIATASISTGQEQRDAHLCSPDFLDAETFPEMIFDSADVEHTGDDRYRVRGELTIRDVTRPVTVELTFGGLAVDPYGDERAGFEGSAIISRKDFGLTYNIAMESMGFLIGDEVTLEFDLAVVRSNEPSYLR